MISYEEFLSGREAILTLLDPDHVHIENKKFIISFGMARHGGKVGWLIIPMPHFHDEECFFIDFLGETLTEALEAIRNDFIEENMPFKSLPEDGNIPL